jgi:hypothetical protein
MNNKAQPKFLEKLVSHKKALLPDPDCLLIIGKGFIMHVT